MTLKELINKFVGTLVYVTYSDDLQVKPAIILDQSAEDFELDDWLNANSIGNREVYLFDCSGGPLRVSLYKERSK